ncbi:OsmC family protein [Carboxylicivirga linearis]|uniref:OsmC family protein n=1 Tax=Carboxylicivirga linearis TaxID=1628157 RepID=A0ABS5JRE1_9BACT|nr:OsmC family protein [Carboxylicivirga linearis]MBS2096971.1 OsmC family protein [Carboxylicivirga linearis]
MKSSVNLKWTGNMSWETELFGHKLVLDAGTENGGEDKGPRPKPLMLTALAGCTGMDVVSILKKMRVEFEDLQVIVEGDMTEEHPKYYEKMHVIYQFKGKDLPMDKLQKAVSLSEEKYCGVSALYKKAIPLTTEIRIVE